MAKANPTKIKKLDNKKPTKIEIKSAKELVESLKKIEKEKGLKPEFVNQGCCSEFKKIKQQVQIQRDRKNQIRKPITKKDYGKIGFKIQSYVGNSRSVYIGNFPTQEIADEAKRIATELRSEYKGDDRAFRELVKSKIKTSHL